MYTLLTLSVFIAGTIVGFFIHKLLFSSNQKSNELAAKASKSESELAQYKLDVAEHLESSAKLLEQMNQTCQTAMAQMAQSTQLLQQATPESVEQMPFFSKETQEQLAQTANLRHKRNVRIKKDADFTEPPLDYSGAPSGLFEDKKQTVTNTNIDE